MKKHLLYLSVVFSRTPEKLVSSGRWFILGEISSVQDACYCLEYAAIFIMWQHFSYYLWPLCHPVSLLAFYEYQCETFVQEVVRPAPVQCRDNSALLSGLPSPSEVPRVASRSSTTTEGRAGLSGTPQMQAHS